MSTMKYVILRGPATGDLESAGPAPRAGHPAGPARAGAPVRLDIAGLSARLDRLETRIDRIEQRLDIVSA